MPDDDAGATHARRLDILVADDHPLIRAGIRACLAGRPGWHVCAEAENGEAAIRLARERRPDLLILDYALPLRNGLEVTRTLCREMAGIGVLIYTMHADERLVTDILQAGARGYVLKTEEDVALLAALEAVAAGTTYFSQDVAPCLAGVPTQASAAAPPPLLTPRELEVVRLVARGETNKSIAAFLNLSVKTVDSHRTAAMRKLNLHTAVELARYAIRNNLVQP